MGDELDDLMAVVSEQGLALKGLQQAAADAEERQKSSHAELLEMMATVPLWLYNWAFNGWRFCRDRSSTLSV